MITNESIALNEILTNALPRLDVGMIYGVVRDASLRAARGRTVKQKERMRMKVESLDHRMRILLFATSFLSVSSFAAGVNVAYFR